MQQKVIFENGAEFVIQDVRSVPKQVRDACRKVMTITVVGEYASVLGAASAGQNWHIQQGSDIFDKSIYTMLLSVTNHLDGTCSFEITTADTLEQIQTAQIAEQENTIAEKQMIISDQENVIAEQNTTIAAQNTELDELTILLLEGVNDDAI